MMLVVLVRLFKTSIILWKEISVLWKHNQRMRRQPIRNVHIARFSVVTLVSCEVGRRGVRNQTVSIVGTDRRLVGTTAIFKFLHLTKFVHIIKKV